MTEIGDSKDWENKPVSPAASPVPAISEEEKGLAQECLGDFESGQYDHSLSKLLHLASLRPIDFKVTHNQAVAAYYRTGCTKTDEFKQALVQICYQGQVFLDDDNLEDVDHAILFYNHAIILYHLRQYREAAKILEKLFQFIEPLEENLAYKVLFLLIEVYLCTHQPDKAVPSLAYLEKLLYGGNGKGQQSGDKDKTSEGSSSQQSTREKDGRDRSPSPLNEKYKLKLHMYKARIYLQLKSMKNCKREIKSVITYAGMTAPACFIKSNFEYLRQNYRKAIKLLNSAPESPSMLKTGECRAAMYYNSLGCIHFYMRKYNLSAYYFRKALQENENALLELPKRNPGQSLSGRPLCTLVMNRRYELLYNSGITLLHAGRPLAAFDCLIEAVQVYHSNARLWLRLAECCIAAKKGSPEEEPKGLPSAPKKGLVQSIIGSVNHRKIILTPGISDNKYSSEGQSAAMPVATLDFASVCLRNALSLLSEQEHSSSTPAPGTSTRTSSESEQTPAAETSKLNIPAGELAPPGAPLKPHEVESLRCSVMANSAYVCLGLGDNVGALEHSLNLLKQPKLSGSHKFLGHMYAAEALVSLDKIADAVVHLSPDNVMDVSVTYPGSSDSSIDKSGNDLAGGESGSDMSETPVVVTRYFPSSIQYAKATLLFNLASAHCLRSESEKARRCLHQACLLIPASEIPQQALLLGVYLELQNGNTPLALQMIKKNQLLPYVKIQEARQSISGTPTISLSTIQAPIGRKIRK
ncbi:CCR4-NOT transcription complex subunit 10-like [Ptychodera flava]|uniref:CCR4-NOT transcription complex subunit 10-like n=1 Tax=Ptychodera flava TaxID=63121 RepID=UPI00396A33CD